MNVPFYEDLFSSFDDMNQIVELNSQQQLQGRSAKKKKSHRNRRMQRYRRKSRKQCVNISIEQHHSTINTIIKQNASLSTSSTVDKTDFRMVDSAKKITNELVAIKNSKPVAKINDSINYASVSDEVLHQITSQVFKRLEKFNNIFNQIEKIYFICQFIGLIDQLSFQQLQEIQWKYYHHIGITRNIWHGRMSKVTAEEYSINYTYGRSKNLLLNNV